MSLKIIFNDVTATSGTLFLLLIITPFLLRVDMIRFELDFNKNMNESSIIINSTHGPTCVHIRLETYSFFISFLLCWKMT